MALIDALFSFGKLIIDEQLFGIMEASPVLKFNPPSLDNNIITF